MTDKMRLKYLDVFLRMCNIQISKELLQYVLEGITAIDDKNGNVTIEDVIQIQKKIKEEDPYKLKEKC